MTHSHGHDTTVIERDGTSMTAGMMIGIAAILLIAIIGLVILFAQPWDDDDGAGGVTDTVPDITDNSGGGSAGEGEGDGGTGGETGGESGGGTDGGATDPGAGQ